MLNLQRKADDRRFLNTTLINILSTESWYQHRVDIDGQEVTLHIFDTAGKVSLPVCLSNQFLAIELWVRIPFQIENSRRHSSLLVRQLSQMC